MAEELTEAGLLDHLAGRGIDLPALKRFILRKCGFHAGNPGITRLGHDPENLFIFLRHFLTHETGPGQIAVDRARLVEFCPKIDQYEIAFADGPLRTWFRLVMGIAAVWADGD